MITIKTQRYYVEMESEMGERNPIGCVVVDGAAASGVGGIDGRYSLYFTHDWQEIVQDVLERAKSNGLAVRKPRCPKWLQPLKWIPSAESLAALYGR
jgi:hypothetical protein